MNRFFFLVALVLLITARASSEDKCSSGLNSKKCSYVVNHSFCEANLPPKDLESKDNLNEIHTYAELKHDPRSALPDSFTICSTIMATDCKSVKPMKFFNVLDNQLEQIIAPGLTPIIDSWLAIDFSTWSTVGIVDKIPPTFPNQWIRSCFAVNSVSGSISWVVEGVSILSMESEKLKSSLKLPRNLSGKLILGSMSYGGKWYSVSNKVTNLNIFSSSLSLEELKNMTKDHNCAKKGDYLAWEDMEWILHGSARLETVNTEELCEGAPLAN